MPQYLSTDPSAGEPVAAAPQAKDTYLSTDASAGDPVTQPEQPSAVSRFVSNAAEKLLPSTTLSDYWEGPAYVAQNPIDSLSLLFGGLRDAHAAEATKTGEAFTRMTTAPTFGGKVAAASEMLGHGAATALPFVGPAAASTGEQLAEGDIAGGLGSATGLLAPFGATKVVKPAMQGAARAFGAGNDTRVNQALAATTKENKVRSARVAPEMVKRGIWNKDLPSLEARAVTESEKAGKAVGAELAKVANKETDVLPLVEAMEQAKSDFVGQSSTGHRVVNVQEPVAAIQKLQDVLMEYGDTISLESLNKVRENWDQVVQRGKGFTAQDVEWKTWAAREGRSILREELSKASPDIDRVMAEYSFWQNVEDIAHATNDRRVGQIGGLRSTIAGAGGLVIGEALAPGSGIASKVGGAALGAGLVAKVKKLTDSPGWKMFTAVQRQRIADAIASGNSELIATTLERSLSAASVQDPVVRRLRPATAP